jgi:hypothetical protein
VYARTVENRFTWGAICLMGVALAIGACKRATSTASPEPIELAWELSAGESLAYRLEATLRAFDRGHAEETEEIVGYVYIDVDDAGAAVLRMEAEPQMADTGSVALEDALGRFVFPLPEGPLGDRPIEQAFVVQGLGTTATQSSPDLAIDEVIERGDKDGDRIGLRFSRRGGDVGESLVDIELSDEGQGVYDTAAGRYASLERSSEISLESSMGGDRIEVAMKLTWSLEFDAERTAQRTRERAERQAHATEGLDLDEYEERYPARLEIERAAEALATHEPGAVLAFHAVANPVDTWTHAMSLDENAALRFASRIAMPYQLGERAPDELIAWIKRALPDTPNLSLTVAQWPDARLRPQLEELAAGRAVLPEGSTYDPDIIAELASRTLEELARQDVSPHDLADVDELEFMEVGMALMAGSDDPRELVPILIDTIESSLREAAETLSGQASHAQLAVQWLEGITSRSYGMDIGGWRAFWAKNQDSSYCQWQIDATEQDREALVLNALGKLRACGDVDDAADVLARHAEGSRRTMSLVAAGSLAEFGDPRAIPALLDALEEGAPLERAQALVTLARFRSTTLGYDPEADEATRAAAISRWRAWADREHDAAGEPEAESDAP